jgi:hypothetical protein
VNAHQLIMARLCEQLGVPQNAVALGHSLKLFGGWACFEQSWDSDSTMLQRFNNANREIVILCKQFTWAGSCCARIAQEISSPPLFRMLCAVCS